METKESGIISPNRISAIIQTYFHNNNITRLLILLINNECVLDGWGDVRVLIQFWKRSVHDAVLDAILPNNSCIFIEAVSHPKKMIITYC